MSSTTNLQNLLVNVFRPIYTYDPISNVYTPKLELSNIDTITANALNVGIFGVGDSNSNVFVGSNAGIGARNSSNNTAVGFNAANSIAYVCNSVYLGFNAGAGVIGFSNSAVNDVIAIGANTSGRGVSNIYIGSGTATDSAITSAGNIFIGHGILAGDVSSRLLIGNSSRITIAGDLSKGWVGFGGIQTPTYSYDSVDVSGYAVVTRGLGVGLADPSGYALSVSGTAVFTDGGYTTTINGANTGTLTQGVYPKVAVLDPSATYPTFLFQDVSSGTMGIRSLESTLAMGLYGSRHIDISTSGSNIQLSTGGVLRAKFDSSGLVVFGDISVTGGIAVSGLGNGVFGGVLLSNSNVTTSTGSNFIGGVVLNNSNISNLGNLNLSGAIVGSTANTSNQIGGVTMSNNDIAYSGSITGSTANTSNQIGGVTLSNNNISYSGTITGSTANTSNQIGGVVLSNGILRATNGTEIAPAYTFANDLSTGLHLAGTSQLGFDTDGVQRMVISNGNVGIGVSTPVQALDISGFVVGNKGAIFPYFATSTGGSVGLPAFINATSSADGMWFPALWNIAFSTNGVERMRIDNSSVGIGTPTPTQALDVSGSIRYSGTITGSTTNTSNQIGGVTLSNNNISYSGAITGSTANTSNTIGGVILNNSNISNLGNLDLSGAIVGSSANTSNQIGGVTLSNNNISYSGTITGSTANTSNVIGGVTLSNNNISYSGTITGSTANTSNQIGGITLSNNNIAYSGTIIGSTANTSNQIGGVVLSNGILRGSNGTASAPSHTFANDLSTGVHLVGTSQIGFDTAGVQRAVLDSTGRLGIGRPDIVSATDLLDVSGRIRISQPNSAFIGPFFSSTSGSATFPSFTTSSTGTDGMFFPAASQVGFSTNSVQRMIISNANVGIGTSAPTTLLDVSGSARVRDALFVNDTNSAGLRFISSGGNAYIQWGSNTGVAGAGTANLYFTGINLGSPSAAFTILSNGNVGVGTATPSTQLDVSGTIQATNLSFRSTDTSSALLKNQIPFGLFIRNAAPVNAVSFLNYTGSATRDFSFLTNDFIVISGGTKIIFYSLAGGGGSTINTFSNGTLYYNTTAYVLSNNAGSYRLQFINET